MRKPKARISFRMWGFLSLAAITIFILVLAVFQFIYGGCSNIVDMSIMPYLPVNYLGCTEVTPSQLVNLYYGRYGSRMKQVEALYNGSPFVFKNVLVTPEMITSMPDGYTWVGLVKCYPLSKEGLNGLKPGLMVDIVGIDAGLCEEYHGVVFTGCVFLPAGEIQFY